MSIKAKHYNGLIEIYWEDSRADGHKEVKVIKWVDEQEIPEFIKTLNQAVIEQSQFKGRREERERKELLKKKQEVESELMRINQKLISMGQYDRY